MKRTFIRSASAAYSPFIILLMALAFLFSANGQNITKVEYFIDTDPGFGSGSNVPVTPSANISNLQFNVALGTVAPGFHTLYVRAKDENGRWSLSQVRSFYKADLGTVALPDVTKAEYFIDTDPGFGMGSNIPLTPSANISNLQFSIDLGTVSSGFHTLYIRAKDENGRWSFSQVKTFYKSAIVSNVLPEITKAEYFIDTDPGFGMGSDIPVTPSSNISNFQFTIDLGTVTTGFHTFYVRTKDENGHWSFSQVKTFYKSAIVSNVLPEITKAEYFIDTDPGFGMGSDIPVVPSANISNLQFTIGLGTVPAGFHTLYVRAKDGNGRWSFCQVKAFYKSVIIPETLPDVTKVEYFFDADPGFGMGTDVPVTPSANISNLSFTIDLSALPPGTHTVWIRAKDSNGKWSLVVWNTFTQASAPVSVSIAASANPVCAGLPVTFTATPVNGGANPAFQWRVNGLNVGSNSPTYSYYPTNQDSVICILTSSLIYVVGNPATSNPVRMTVKPVPTPTINGIDTICAGASGVIYATEGGKSGYAWQVSSGGTITSGIGTDTITVSWNSGGAQTVSVNYDGGNGCSAPSPTVLNVMVHPMPAPSITGLINPCLGATGVVYTTESGKSSYSWAVSSGGTITGGSNTNAITVDWINLGAQTVSVNYIGSNGCTVPEPTVKNVTVNPILPVSVTIASSAVQVCKGTIVTFTATAVNGGNSPVYQWKVNGTNSGTNNPTFGYTPSNGDTITCVLTSGVPCPTGNPATSNAIILTVDPVPTPTITGATTVCSGITNASYTTEAGKSGYTWMVSSGGSITGGSGTNEITVSWNVGGSQTVSVNYAGGNGCSAPMPTVLNVTVNPSPNPSIAGPASVCQGASDVVYTTESGMGGYQWTITSGGIITSGINTNAIMVTWNGTGAQHVSVNYTGGNGCTATNPTSKEVTVSPIVPVGVSIVPSVNPACSGSSVTFIATPANGGPGPVYQWAVNGTNVGSNSFIHTYNPANNDLVTCTLTSNLACISGNPATSSPVIMTVNPRPDAPNSGGNLAGCTNALPAILTATAPPGSTVDWYNTASGGGLLLANSTNYSTSTAGTYYAGSRNVATGCTSISRTPVTLTISTSIQYFIDADGDGYGNPEVSLFTCSPSSGYVTNGLDCNDNDPNVNPGAQYIAYTGNLGFTNSIVSPLSGSPYTFFHFEADYFDATNSFPPSGYPRLMLDYEGNGSFLDPNDRVIIMTATNPLDLTTNNGKRYFVEMDGLPYGANWKSRIVVNDGSLCSTTFGPFDCPDVMHEPNLYLFANDISFSVPHPAVSQNITVSAVVHNESDFDAQNFVVHLINQNDPSTVYPDITVANLPAHQNTTVHWNITTQAVPAWCPMQVTVDYTNVIAENNELDNSAVRPFVNGNYQVAGAIVVQAAVSPESSFSEQYAYLNLWGRAWYTDLAVQLPDTSVAGATVECIIAETNDTLYGYTNSSGYFSIYFPAPVTPGTYHVTTSVTDFTLTGSDTAHFHILPAIIPETHPNLSLNYCHSVEVQPVNPHSAGSATLVARVVNNGNATAVGPIEVEFSYNTGGSWMGYYYGDLNAGQTVNVSATAPVPPSTTTLLTAYADPNNLIPEWYESAADNSSTDDMCYDFQPVPLCWSNFWDHTYCIDQSTNIYCGLNIYHLYDANPVEVLFEVSGPGISGWQNLGIGTLANATRNCACPFMVMSPFGPFTFTQTGAYTFRMTSDPNNIYPECSEANNVLVVTVNVVTCYTPPPVRKPNLAFTACKSLEVRPVNPMFPGSGTLVAHITNNGDTTATGPIQVAFSYSNGGGTFMAAYPGNLVPGQSTEVTINEPLPEPATTILTAVIDPADSIHEWYETDNTSSENMCWEFQPVANCGPNFWSHTYLVGQSTSLAVGMNVQHLYDANPLKVKFEVKEPGSPVWQNLGNALLNDATRNCWCPWIVVHPSTYTFFASGTYTFRMTADPDNEYVECDETNNVFMVTVEVLNGSDMRILSQFINPSSLNPEVNDSVSLIVSYENIGNSNVGNTMKLRVKVDNDVLEDVYPVSGLATGDHASVAISNKWASDLPGAHIIRAIIDADNQVGETNETNNEATRAIIVGESANLYFQLFAVSNSTPDLNGYININSRIGNAGDVNCTATVKFYYISNSNDTIPIGQSGISVFAHDSAILMMPWVVTDDQTTIIGKIVNTNVQEFNPDDNTATVKIGGFKVNLTSTSVCIGGNNGSLAVHVTGGAAPYLYIWNNGFIGQTLTAGAGEYAVTVTDNLGLSNNASGAITEYPPFVPGIEGPSTPCYGSSGNIYTTEPGMSGYSWTISPGGTLTGGGTNSSNTATVKWNAAGAQSVSVNYTNPLGCTGASPIVFSVAVYPQFEAGSVSSGQEICYNTVPSVLTGVEPTGGNSPYSYQWQQSTDNVTFTSITGATSLNYSPPALTQTTHYRQVQTSASNCGSLATNVVTIAVYPLFVVGSVSADQVICYNTGPVSLTGVVPAGGNSPYTYQWQKSTDNVTFTDITGATSLHYSPTALTTTSYFRQVQTSASGCGSLITNVVTITVYPQFVVGSVSGSQTICHNTIPSPLTGIVPTGGNAPYAYQWQQSSDQVTFNDITGATSRNYAPPALTTTTHYRQIQVSASDCGLLPTNVVTITVYPQFLAGSISANQVICYNTVPALLTGNAPSGGNPPYTSQWQRSTNNVNFTNITGATSLNYQPLSLTATTWFRLVQYSASGCGSLYTNVVAITVKPAFVEGSITSDQVICHNTVPASLTGVAPTGGKTPYSYQWQRSTDNATFVSISGATLLNYSPPALTLTTYYRQLQVSAGGCGSITTNVVTITVYPQFIVGTIASSQAIPYNSIPVALTRTAPIGGSPPYSYQWQSSANNATFVNIPGATLATYQPGALTATTHYRQIQYSANGCSGSSPVTNVVTITVYPNMVAGTIAADQVIALHAVPALLTGSAPTGGNPPYTYQWEKSEDNLSFANIPGATGIDYQPDALSVTTYFRLMQVSTGDFGVTTNVVTIAVVQVPPTLILSNIVVASNQFECYDATQTIIVGGSGSTFLVQPGGSVNLIAGQNIRMLDGSKVVAGGYLHGYITSSGQYCLPVKVTGLVGQIEAIERIEGIGKIEGDSDGDFRCFPNPTSGRFNLLLSSEPGETPVAVKIYNMLGVEILSRMIFSGRLHEFSVEGQSAGIYLVSVNRNGKVGIIKIVRQ